MILYHGEIDYFPTTLGLKVQNYSNNHMITAVYKKNRSKLILSVPECAVRRSDEDMSNVIPVKRNPPKKDCDLKVKPKVAMEALETKVPTKGLNFFISSQSGEDENKVSFKVDTATQTFSPNGLYTTEPNVQNKNVTKVQNKRKSFSRIKSEFSECLYPFDVVEDWVNDCPSECSEVSHVSFETCEDIPAYPNLSENDRNILLQLSDPSLREYFLGIRGLHPDYTSKFKIEKRKTSYNEPREYLQKNNAPSSSSDYSQGLYPKISDTEWFQESLSLIHI